MKQKISEKGGLANLMDEEQSLGVGGEEGLV